MFKSREARSDIVLLTHLEVLAEVLVAAPPVEMDHADALVPPNLMEVGVTNVVLLAVSRETAISNRGWVRSVSLSQVPPPVLYHLLLLIFDEDIEQETLVEVEAEAHPGEADSVGLVKRVQLPVCVAEGILEEASDVFEGSPFLCLVTGLFGVVYKLREVTVGFFGQRSKISQLVKQKCIGGQLTFQSCQHAR